MTTITIILIKKLKHVDLSIKTQIQTNIKVKIK